jgi:autotransporter-associated beta strand protein
MHMTSSVRPNKLCKYRLTVLGMSAAVYLAGSQAATAQSITVSFVFDGQSGVAASTQTLTTGAAAQTFTVDVFATIAGDATHTDATKFGLRNIKYRGFSGPQTGAGAFATGATVGYSGNFVGLGAFTGTNTTAPKSADTGSTTNGQSVILTADGITDFGQNTLLSNASQSIPNFTFGTGTGSIEIAQFRFTTGQASASAGTTTTFLPVIPNTNSAVNYTQDGSTSIIGQITPGTGIKFVVVTRQTGSASWNSNVNGNYNDMFNWDPNQIPDGAGLVATFGNGTTTTVNAPIVTVTVNAPERVGTLNFNNTNGTSFILGNDGIAGDALTLNNNGAGGSINSLTGNNSIFSNLVLADNATFNIAAGSSVLVSVGNITETGASRSLTKTGAGTLTIDTPSSYTGSTLVSAGTLVTTPTGTLSAGPLVVNAANGVTSLVSLNNNQSVSSLSGADSGSGVATVSVGSGTTLTVAQSSNTTFDGKLSLASGGAALVKSGGGSLETRGAPSLGDGGSISVSGGTLRFNVTAGTATVGTGVAAAVSGAATLELAGSVSALSSNISAAHRVDVANNSSAAAGLLVSGTNQQVGGISGAGNTSVVAGGSLTANHIIQSALIIGGTAGSHGLVTIAASSASGNPLVQSSGFGSVGSLTPSDFSGEGVIGSANLSSGDSMDLAALSGGNSAAIGNSSPVPEPSTFLLAIFAVVGGVGAKFAKRHFRSQII